MAKPQNIGVTSDERRGSGQTSAVRVIAAGMAPPRPSRVTKRKIVSIWMSAAKAEATVASPKKGRGHRQDRLAAIAVRQRAENKGLAISPNRPAANSGASSAGVAPHCAFRARAMKPMAAVSIDHRYRWRS